MEDSLPDLPLMIILEKDTASFHAYNRSINGLNLRFAKQGNDGVLKDQNTGSLWNVDGKSIGGATGLDSVEIFTDALLPELPQPLDSYA